MILGLTFFFGTFYQIDAHIGPPLKADYIALRIYMILWASFKKKPAPCPWLSNHLFFSKIIIMYMVV